jgi:peptidoglycan hydrolase-like protein with peptidoglycan-binding domain
MKAVRTRVVFILLMTGVIGLCLVSRASASDQDNVKKVQETLRAKGYDPGPIDGVMGSKTRQALSQYQKAENLPVTGHLDAGTAGKLGVAPESAAGDFQAAGKEMEKGGEGVGHEIKQGKPVAAGKDLGEGVGKGSVKVGEGVGKESMKAGAGVSEETRKVGAGVSEGSKKVGGSVSKGGKKVGEGVKKAVSPDSDNNDPEKKQ